MTPMRLSCCLIIFIIAGYPAFTTPEQFNQYFIDASKKAKSSVVMITVFNKKIRGGEPVIEKTAYGSGTCILENQYLVTNCHVLEKGNYFCITHNGIHYPVRRFPDGRLYLHDQKTDIALLKIDATPEQALRPIAIGDSEQIATGEWVIAIGNPFGLHHSITGGIISSKGRDNIGFSDIEDFIQSDVPINPGNSGGPLVNLRGDMVGLNTAIRTETGGFQGISFSIPSNIVIQVCRDLIRYGRVRRGWIGFVIKEKGNRADSPEKKIEVLSVVRDSPADIAGIKKGDSIREIDGQEVTSLGMILKHIGMKQTGAKVLLTVSRAGRLRDFKLTLREKQEYRKIRKGLQEFYRDYGIEVDENADSDDIIITRVTPQGFRNGFREGDVVVSINNRKVRSLEDFVKASSRERQKGKRMVIARDDQFYYFSLQE